MPSDYTPRLSIELSEDQRDRLNHHIGHVHGLKKAVFSSLVDIFIGFMDAASQQEKEALLGAILTKRLSITDLITTSQHGRSPRPDGQARPDPEAAQPAD